MQVARSICSQLTQAVVRIGADEHVHTFHVLPTGATTKMQLWGEGVQQGKGVQAIPFAEPPASLPADMVGYVGFDPLGVSTLMDINFLREAELKHCRVAMLAAAGAIAQDLYHFPVMFVYCACKEWREPDGVSVRFGGSHAEWSADILVGCNGLLVWMFLELPGNGAWQKLLPACLCSMSEMSASGRGRKPRLERGGRGECRGLRDAPQDVSPR